MPYKNADIKRKHAREWIAHRRAKHMTPLGPCSRCGSTEKLLLHHLDPAKKISHRIWSWSEERILEEVAKCVVLCSKCHASLHLARPVTHGTHTGYSYYGCRCNLCKKAHANYCYSHRGRMGKIGGPTRNGYHEEEVTASLQGHLFQGRDPWACPQRYAGKGCGQKQPPLHGYGDRGP
jgi:hypothetical protein